MRLVDPLNKSAYFIVVFIQLILIKTQFFNYMKNSIFYLPDHEGQDAGQEKEAQV